MVNSSMFTELYAPGLRKVIFESYTYGETEYDKFLNVATSKKQYEEDYRMGGFGAVPEKPEGTNVIYDDPVPDSTVRFYWRPFGKGFRATHEAMVDELYGQFNKMAKSLGKAFRAQTELIGASLLDNAFTAPGAGDTNSGYDGLALCDLAHPLARGGTHRNEPTAPVDFSHAALQDALVDFDRIVDESGIPIKMIPKYLVYAPELNPLVQEVLKTSGVPHSADNTINTNQGVVTPIMSHYMADTDAWFILADKSELDIWFFWREKFTTDAADDFDSGDGKMKGYMRGDVGWGDHRGVWGSPGV